MARPLRIEYPGAVYHLQNYGNRNMPIYEDDDDRDLFLTTLREATERCRWNVYAYALMDNHFHLLLETVEPNLSDGMKWMLTAYTQRFNRRHGYTGHLFGGRYHSMLVEAANSHYFSTIIDYIHLNPARSGIARVRGFEGAGKWTSLPAWMASPENRPAWIHPERGLACFACEDTEEGRLKYYIHLLARYEAESMDERSLIPLGHTGPGTVQRGWCYGSKAFRQSILSNLREYTRRPADGSLGKCGQEASEHLAENIVKRGCRAFGLTQEELHSTAYSHPDKLVIALAVHKATIVPYAWISARLNMGAPRSLGTLLHRAKKMYAEDAKVRAWIDRITAETR